MDNSLTYLYVAFFLAIAMYILSAIITLAFVIPLQMKQAQVKDDLIDLRRQLLGHGVFTEVVSLLSIGALTMRYVVSDPPTLRYILTTVILLHAIGTISKALIFYRIYHSKYPVEAVIIGAPQKS